MPSMRLPSVFCAFALAASSFILSGCDSHAADTTQAPAPKSAAQVAQAAPAGQSRAEVFAHMKQMNVLGEKLFMDPSLSGSGKLAGASCHSPQHAFCPPNGLSVQLGGNDMHQPGLRAVPSLRYLPAIGAAVHRAFSRFRRRRRIRRCRPDRRPDVGRPRRSRCGSGAHSAVVVVRNGQHAC